MKEIKYVDVTKSLLMKLDFFKTDSAYRSGKSQGEVNKQFYNDDNENILNYKIKFKEKGNNKKKKNLITGNAKMPAHVLTHFFNQKIKEEVETELIKQELSLAKKVNKLKKEAESLEKNNETLQSESNKILNGKNVMKREHENFISHNRNLLKEKNNLSSEISDKNKTLSEMEKTTIMKKKKAEEIEKNLTKMKQMKAIENRSEYWHDLNKKCNNKKEILNDYIEEITKQKELSECFINANTIEKDIFNKQNEKVLNLEKKLENCREKYKIEIETFEDKIFKKKKINIMLNLKNSIKFFFLIAIILDLILVSPKLFKLYELNKKKIFEMFSEEKDSNYETSPFVESIIEKKSLNTISKIKKGQFIIIPKNTKVYNDYNNINRYHFQEKELFGRITNIIFLNDNIPKFIQIDNINLYFLVESIK